VILILLVDQMRIPIANAIDTDFISTFLYRIVPSAISSLPPHTSPSSRLPTTSTATPTPSTSLLRLHRHHPVPHQSPLHHQAPRQARLPIRHHRPAPQQENIFLSKNLPLVAGTLPDR